MVRTKGNRGATSSPSDPTARDGGAEQTTDGETGQATVTEIREMMRSMLSELKFELKAEIRALHSTLQSFRKDISELQERVTQVEEFHVAASEAIRLLLADRKHLREKTTDLERRSRKCNIRIYGVPENSEGGSMIDYLENFLMTNLEWPVEEPLQIQRAHRVPNQKSTEGNAPPRSIIACFQVFKVKEKVISLAWKKKVFIEGTRIFFDHDYPLEDVEKRKAYKEVKKALKAKDIRFRTPHTKMRVNWDTGAEVYDSARKAALALTKRGIAVPVPAEEDPGVRLARLIDSTGWRRVGSDAAPNAREKLQRFRRISD